MFVSQSLEGEAVDQDVVESVIGEGTIVDGRLRSKQPIRICGTLQGEVESEQRVVVEANANVRARVTAHEVIVDGELSGEVFCLGRTRISRTGRVVGEISTEKIVLDEGAYFEGRLEMPTALAT